MKKSLNFNVSHEKIKDLDVLFDALNDDEIANSEVTSKIFLSSEEGERKVIDRIGKINGAYAKDGALFKVAKLYYEKNDIDQAIANSQAIKSEEEKARCLTHIANAILHREKDLELADKVIGLIKTDNYEYKKYFEEAKKKLANEI